MAVNTKTSRRSGVLIPSRLKARTASNAASPARPIRSLSNETLWEKVQVRLREEILTNQLLPGTELQEVALAESLGVSRGPVREALGRLGVEGLVTIRPRRGAIVTGLSKAAFLGAYQVREALESLAVRLATPRLTDSEIAELLAFIREMEQEAKRDDVPGFFELNTTFHQVFVDASGNETLQQMHRRSTGEMRRYRGWSLALRGNLRRSIKEHQVIVRAVSERDVERAVHLMSQHIRVPQERLETMADDSVVKLALGSRGAPRAGRGRVPSP